jgi:hypothetical protein
LMDSHSTPRFVPIMLLLDGFLLDFIYFFLFFLSCLFS